MRVLLAGWFSFEGMGATAGDLISRDLVFDWLLRAGREVDVAVAPPFTNGVDWRTVDPRAYSHVVFVCGPFGNGEPVAPFLERFADSRLVGVNLSMLQALDEWDPFDLLLERDSSRRSLPDLVFLGPRPRVPVAGLVLIHSQPEYGHRDVHDASNDALRRLVKRREVAAVPIDTRLDVANRGGLRTPPEIEAVFAKMDVVATTRLHGMVLALKNGIPAIAVDPVAGGAKIAQQAATIGWPVVFPGDAMTDQALDDALDFCLKPEARSLAAATAAHARRLLDAPRAELLSYFGGEWGAR